MKYKINNVDAMRLNSHRASVLKKKKFNAQSTPESHLLSSNPLKKFHRGKKILNNRQHELSLQTNSSIKSYSFSNKSTKNWNKASLHSIKTDCNFNDSICLLDKMTFYVDALRPPISPTSIHIGDKIFSMSMIPGRENSMIFENLCNNAAKKMDVPNEIEIDNKSVHQSSVSVSENLHNDIWIDHSNNAIGCSSQQCEQAISIDRFMTMFNNCKYSDIFILLKSGEVLYAHKFVLAAWQCDDEAIKEDQYVMTSMEDEIVIKTFKYLYSDGKYPIDDIIGSDDCIELCKKFGINHSLLHKSFAEVTPTSRANKTYHSLISSPKTYFSNETDTVEEMQSYTKYEQEIFHSTPNCYNLKRSVSFPDHNLTASSDADLFGSFSQNISVSMDGSKNIPHHTDYKSPGNEISEIENPTLSSNQETLNENIHSLDYLTQTESKQVSVNFEYPSFPLSPNNKSKDDSVVILHIIPKSNPDANNVNSPLSPTSRTDDFAYYSPLRSVQSPKFIRKLKEDTYDFLASPLPLSERLKLHSKLASIPDQKVIDKPIISPVKLHSKLASITDQKVIDKPIISPVKKVRLRKTLSDGSKPKTGPKRKSNDVIPIVLSPSDGTEESNATKTKKIKTNKKNVQFETPPRQNFPFNPFTPMPDFEHMATPELQRHRIKFGLKKELPKKKSILYLQECHRQTHRVDNGTDSESLSSEDGDNNSDDEDIINDLLREETEDDFVKRNEYLYHFLKTNYFTEILTYKTVNVTSIINELKAVDVKLNIKDLYDYLDHQCISYKKVDDIMTKIGKPKKTKKFVI